ncbi:MAG: methyltransferase domain-containing protein [Candidatus Pacebacteria bacterium]|nr:methyltransferase domain-containing protein [Candidatus Paceibacterota bacterium]MBP9842398.1 methyltransferase domain-containing protein [Candidatus Paceibacterota bacterium]
MTETSESTFVVPDIVVSHFHLKSGDVIADFGAGSGYFLKALSSRVGTDGRVYACEIQKSLVEKVSEQARTLGLNNIHPMWCDLEESNGIKIKEETLDVGILVNTLFQIENKQVGIIEMARTIRSGGRLIIIDWTDSAGGMGPTENHVVSLYDAVTLCEANGFVLEREFEAGSHHYGLAFRKL